MSSNRVTITTPSRLHFGMFSFGHSQVRQFGGMGLMIGKPRTRLVATTASSFKAHGPQAERVERFVKQLLSGGLLPAMPGCEIEVAAAPPGHAGLGSGTQLALATAAALDQLVGLSTSCPRRWAAALGRGVRSAVGTYGFERGGLIVEAGKFAGDEISPLITRVALPRAWRFLLIWPSAGQGLSGQAERSAFESLPSVSPEVTDQLCHEALLNLIPAARDGRFDELSESLFRFGHTAGMCFAHAQGGPFSSPLLERRVEAMRSMGVRGVGQSSWGPTLFALLADENAARALADQLRKHPDFGGSQFVITPIDNQGVRVGTSPMIDASTDCDDQGRPPVNTSGELA